MHTPKLTLRKTLAAASLLSLLALSQPRAVAQGKPSRFRQFMQNLATFSGGSVVGGWRGAKTENDPIHGGYLNLAFAFVFTADGQYQEAAYMGSRQVMYATGTYQQSGSVLSFNPQQCNFASEDLAQVVRFFPIPVDTPAQDSISFSPIQGGPLMSLKDSASGEDWGLKPAQ